MIISSDSSALNLIIRKALLLVYYLNKITSIAPSMSYLRYREMAHAAAASGISQLTGFWLYDRKIPPNGCRPRATSSG